MKGCIHGEFPCRSLGDPCTYVGILAGFTSARVGTYSTEERAYIFTASTSSSSEPPALKTYAWGTVCTYHVNWNGATDVAFCKVYGYMDYPNIGFVELVAVNRTGFETEYNTPCLYKAEQRGGIRGKLDLCKRVEGPGDYRAWWRHLRRFGGLGQDAWLCWW